MSSHIMFSKLRLICLIFCAFFVAFTSKAQIGPPPIILVHPIDKTVSLGGSVTFEVSALSLGTIYYEWRKNGEAIVGETSKKLKLTGVVLNNAGKYSVRVSNASGSVNSLNATLTVTGASPPPLIEAAAMTSGGFQLQLAGTQKSTYVTWASSNYVNWEPIATNNTANGNLVLTDAKAVNHANRFYSVTESPAWSALQQNSSDGGNKIDIKLGLRGAQSFRFGNAGESDYWINQVVLRLSRDSDAPNADLDFSIGTGINSGAVAGSTVGISPSDITNTSGGNSFQEFEIMFPSPVGPFAAGTTYYLNLECQASNGKVYLSEYSSNNGAYLNGTYFKGGSDDQKDILFQIWGCGGGGGEENDDGDGDDEEDEED